MKYLGLLCLVCAPLVAAGCDEPADGSLASCATALVGEFAGDKSGPATALLSFEGELLVEFASEGEDREFFGAADVDEGSGSLTPTSDVMQMEGTFDFDTCEASGTWSILNSTGTWEISLR